ncbi:MAG: hypothetical protein KJ000_13165 [Pirellulaceae bacterium]|nr:hypothetical protein [Pirellulaceae bacterium]
MQHAHAEQIVELEEDLKRSFLKSLAPEDRMRGLAPEDRLRGLAPEDRLRGLRPEEILQSLSPEASKRLRQLLNRDEEEMDG